MRVKGIIFDLDGTLLYTLPDITGAINRALRTMGYPERSIDECRRLVGWGLKTAARKALPGGLDRDTSSPMVPDSAGNSYEHDEDEPDEQVVDQLFNLVLKEYNTHPVDQTTVYDGIPELLDFLTEENIALAVLTNKEAGLTKLIMDHFFKDWNFRSVRGDGPGMARKPDPAGVYAALDELGLLSRDVMFVGDSGVDMETASNAGIPGIGVLWGYREAREMTEKGASLLVSRPEEIADHIRNLN